MNRRNMEMDATKAMGLIYLARAISDFTNFPIRADDEFNQILSVLIHGVSNSNWQFIMTEVYYSIEHFVYGGKIKDWAKKPGMIASLDYQGTRTAMLTERSLIEPHVHALIILPDTTEFDVATMEWAINTNIQEIYDKVGRAMYNKHILGTDALDNELQKMTIHIKPYQNKTDACFTTAVSYQIKSVSFLDSAHQVTPMAYPFDLKLRKLQTRNGKKEAAIAKSDILLKNLIFEPHKYFAGSLIKIDERHQSFLDQYYKLTDYPEEGKLDIRKKAINHIENGRYDYLDGMAYAIITYLREMKNEKKKGN
jgi:hypothetical protein